MLAGALVNQAADTAPGAGGAALGAGRRSSTSRACGLELPLWADILLANAASVRDVLRDSPAAWLERVNAALERGDGERPLGFVVTRPRRGSACAAPTRPAPRRRPACWSAVPNRPGRSRRSRPPWYTRASTSRTSACVPVRPTARASWSCIVGDPDAAREAVRLVEARGYRAGSAELRLADPPRWAADFAGVGFRDGVIWMQIPPSDQGLARPVSTR